MPAADTNVLVRFIVRDDSNQAHAADEFVRAGVWVSLLVLAETAWVLSVSHEYKKEQIVLALEALLDSESVSIQDEAVARAALAAFRGHGGVSFPDCLILEMARRAGQLPLGSFDRKLTKLEGTRRL